MAITKIALALSGGGNRGIIHLGVLHAFDEKGIQIDAISGTSAGAIMGSLYCSGLSINEIREVVNKQSFSNILHFSIKGGGLADMKGLRKILKENIKQNDYSLLKKKFFVCASNIDESRYEVFSEGDLFSHISASASIPILFKPVKIGEYRYVDGGLFNNLPVDPLLGKYDKIIGVHVNNYKISEKHSIKTVANQIFSMVIKQNVIRNLKKCDIVINPELSSSYRSFNKKNTKLLFDIGYEAGLQCIKENNL